MNKKTCCVTGHRNIPEHKMPAIQQQLKAEIKKAINEGYTTFISGFAEGADLMFARCVVEEKKTNFVRTINQIAIS